MTRDRFARSLSVFAIGFVLLMMPAKVFGHCDGMDGPVVQAAQRALAKGDVNLVLIWVQANDEAEIRKVFAKTLAVRKLNPEARELADLYFFETLVRIHRAGEGAPYTGLKPAGRDLGPAIPAADKAIETGSVEPLVTLITSESANGIRERFQKVTAAKKFNAEDVNAGREYVKAYVEFVHYVEGLHESVQGSGHEHPRRLRRRQASRTLEKEPTMADAIRTAPREDRVLSGPAITFAIAEEINLLKQEPEWISGTRNSVTVVKTSNLSIVLTAIKKGATLCGHEVDGPITLQVLSGAVQFGVAGEPRTLAAGTVIALDKAIPHDIQALEDSELLLTIVREIK